ncbi:hypothetical protein V5O48_010603 [Marasmius crinis-equi]|uniref:Ser-Thr-rich glycosyl-phosphatidyl-inositol-anchored membrane family-domain-containing protein n=1 Tax=Marasmius crinis-equi TaxID=585013 RepID=A0ABR3F7Y0_9AGAR
MLYKSLLATAFAVLVTEVSAATILPRVRWNPPILSPNETTVWRIGDLVNVTWDLSEIPQDLTEFTGTIQLNNEKGPLADIGFLSEGFDLRVGFAEVDVPWYDVPPGKNYSITLFGDSGNRSPQFEIIAREEYD